MMPNDAVQTPKGRPDLPGQRDRMVLHRFVHRVTCDRVFLECGPLRRRTCAPAHRRRVWPGRPYGGLRRRAADTGKSAKAFRP